MFLNGSNQFTTFSTAHTQQRVTRAPSGRAAVKGFPSGFLLIPESDVTGPLLLGAPASTPGPSIFVLPMFFVPPIKLLDPYVEPRNPHPGK